VWAGSRATSTTSFCGSSVLKDPVKSGAFRRGELAEANVAGRYDGEAGDVRPPDDFYISRGDISSGGFLADDLCVLVWHIRYAITARRR